MGEYETIIGLEVHVQLKTETKLFCSCSTDFGEEPNSLVCPICLGLPGILPALNQKVVELALKTGLALDCQLNKESAFDRKSYFYPDLPKGYQTTQYYKPICQDGKLEIYKEDGEAVPVLIKQIHIEEDAAKLIHEKDRILVDYNRAGMPLIEIVTTPSIPSPEIAEEFLLKLKNILEYLEVSDCNMEEGSLRCDANISLRKQGAKEFGTKTEIKNMNSFRALRQALHYEKERQLALLKDGQEILEETRSWDEGQRKTLSMRKKEAQSYRYFPEPDLPPLVLKEDFLAEIKDSLPELPRAKYLRFCEEYALGPYAADILVNDKDLAQFFEEAAQKADPIEVSKWVLGEYLSLLNEEKLSVKEAPFKSYHLVELLKLLEEGTISSRMAKEIFEEIFATGKSPAEIVQTKGLKQISDEGELLALIDKVLEENASQVADYLAGNENIFRYLVGQVMRHTKGKASPQITSQLLESKLKEL